MSRLAPPLRLSKSRLTIPTPNLGTDILECANLKTQMLEENPASDLVNVSCPRFSKDKGAVG